MTPDRTPPGPGQESVWDYPRPPRLEPFDGHVRVVFNGVTLADTHDAKRVLETSHPPTFYIPPADVRWEHLQSASGSSMCEWKGAARYFDVEVDGRRAARAAWGYPEPTPGFAALKDHLAFYAGPMDGCFVDGERVIPQPGGFYGGWITSGVVGPFKGVPGTRFW
jgi:uncharacterized protein (DUF427 family)